MIWDRDGADGEALQASTTALLAQPLNADAAIQVGLLNSNSLQAMYEDLGIAQADFVQAGMLPNPNFAGFIRWFDRSPGDPNWNLGLHLPLQIFLIPLRKKLAGAALDEAVQRVTAEVLKQASETRIAFYALQADMQVITARRTINDLAAVAGEYAGRQYKAGNIDDLTYAAERATQQQANLALAGAESEARISRDRLRRSMGLSGSDVAWSIQSDAPVPTDGIVSESELVELALSSSPDVAAAHKAVEREQFALTLARNWWLDTASVGVETERAPGGGYQTGPDFSLELPLFDQKQAVFARHAALIRQSRRRLADVEDRVREDVRMSLDRMNTAMQTAHLYATEVVPLRQQMSAMTEKRYQGMLVGVFELLTLKTEESNAVIAAVRARQDYWIARSDLELAVGRQLPAGESAPAQPTPSLPVDTPTDTPAPTTTQPDKSMSGMPGM